MNIPMAEPTTIISLKNCKFCDSTYLGTSIKEHEENCIFNKLNKCCFTCKFYEFSTRFGSRICLKNLNVEVVREFGNCNSWISETLQKDREESINKILE